jgi:hypothetical protein
MTFAEYIRPELLILVPVLYVLGAIIKDSAAIQNRYIPAILGGVGIALSLLYVLGTGDFSATGVFTAITQGILVAGAAVYTNELIVQLIKKPEDESNGQ